MSSIVSLIIMFTLWAVLPPTITHFSNALYDFFAVPSGYYTVLGNAGVVVGRWASQLGIDGYLDFLILFFGLLLAYGIPIYVWSKLLAHPRRIVVYLVFIVFMGLALELYG